jgi:hypothetical protein
MTDLIPQLESSLSFARELNALKEQNRVLRKKLGEAIDLLDAIMYGKTVMIGPSITEFRAALTNKVPA